MRNLNADPKYVRFPERESAYVFIDADTAPFQNAVVGITYPHPDYYISRPASHGIHVLEYILEGEGEILIGGKWQRADAGKAYILRADEAHTYRACARNPWKKIWINYTAHYLSPLLDAYGIQTGIYTCPEVKPLFEEALDLCPPEELQSKQAFRLAECVHKIVSLLAESQRSAQSGSHARLSDELRIREALNAALYSRLSLDELSDRLHISKSNVIRIFKRHYGMTPYEYLLQAKIEAAKILLRNTTLSVKEIALRLCITDEHYFSTLFHKRVGMRPLDFRRKE